MRRYQNNETSGAATPKAPEQTTNSALTINSTDSVRQDASEPLANLGSEVIPIATGDKEPVALVPAETEEAAR